MPDRDTGRLEREIEHGRRIRDRAGEVWNWQSPAGRLRWARRVKMLTADLAAGMRVLELGCGTGTFTRELAKSGADITAIDISPDLLERAGALEGVRFACADACATPFATASFDAIVGSSVLHHLDLGPALAEISRLLAPGGRVAFTEPNMLNPQIAVQKNVPAIKRWMGDSPDETAFVRWSLARALRRAGLGDIAIECFDFLHPQLPKALIRWVRPLGRFLERVPGISEIAGSLWIRARKM